MIVATGNIITVCIAIIIILLLLFTYDRDIILAGLFSNMAAGLLVSVFRHVIV